MQSQGAAQECTQVHAGRACTPGAFCEQQEGSRASSWQHLLAFTTTTVDRARKELQRSQQTMARALPVQSKII